MIPRQTVFAPLLLLAACGGSSEPKKTIKVPVVAVKTDTPPPAADTIAKAKAKRAPNESPNGDIVSIMLPANQVQIDSKAGTSRMLDADALHPPAGNKALFGIGAMSTVYLDDGSLLIGVADGTLISLDPNDRVNWSVGFRGAVTGITPTDDARVVITTQRGVIASVTTDGQVLWEKQFTPGALTDAVIGPNDHIYAAGPRGVLAVSPEGQLVFSHASSIGNNECCTKEPLTVDGNGRIKIGSLDILASDPHPAIASSEPVFLLEYERVLQENVTAMVSTGPDELLLLVNGPKVSELVRYSKGTTKRFKLPQRASKKDRIDEDSPFEKPTYVYDDVVIGPNGNPWVLGRATFAPISGMSIWFAQPAKAAVFELVGNNVRERTDLKEVIDSYRVSTYVTTRIRASHEGPSQVFCWGTDDGDNVCVIYNGTQFEAVSRGDITESVNRVGNQFYVVPNRGPIDRVVGKELAPFVRPEKTPAFTSISGTADDDLWYTTQWNSAYHYDGKSFTEFAVPQTIESGVLARSRTDAWSRDGQLHWDGKHWSIVGGAPVASTMVLRGRDEVWIGNSEGLYQGKSPGPSFVRIPPVKSLDDRLPTTWTPLPLDAPLAGFSVTKTSIEVNKSTPLTTAKRVEVARDGTLWFEAWDQLVQMDTQGQTTVIDKSERRIAFDRWFYPEGLGRGIASKRARETEMFNERDSLRRFENGKSVDAEMKLPGKDIMAISGNQDGIVWIIGSVEAGSPYGLIRSQGLEFGIHALVRPNATAKFQSVLDLPALSYADMAVTPEGGGFFVGALNAGPIGEGFLLHAKGKLGAESLTRRRATATLLAVAAVSNDEAWAVGAMGLVMHVKGDTVERFMLPSKEWLRAVVVNGPNQVWIGGDGGTLLHYDGKKFHPVPHPLGSHAAFSGLGIAQNTVWATSPSGILRIEKR